MSTINNLKTTYFRSLSKLPLKIDDFFAKDILEPPKNWIQDFQPSG